MFEKIKAFFGRVSAKIDEIGTKFFALVRRSDNITAYMGGWTIGEGFVHCIVTASAGVMLFSQAPAFAMFMFFLAAMEIIAPVWMTTRFFVSLY